MDSDDIQVKGSFIERRTVEATAARMVDKFGQEHSERIATGVRQVAHKWRQSDGEAAVFEAFCLDNFYTEKKDIDEVFTRLQSNLESLYGNLHRIQRRFQWKLHVNNGSMLRLDQQFGGFNVYAHIEEDLFVAGIAFTVLLNFRVFSLDDKIRLGPSWKRRQWAEARLADDFIHRVPAEVLQKMAVTQAAVEHYISNYTIHMHNLVNEKGDRPFPPGLKLISHWGLRDEIKALYADPDGLVKQRMIQKVMERIITQEIPAGMVNSDSADWDPFANDVWKAGTREEIACVAESGERYRNLWRIFESEKLVDPHMPSTPTLIARRFNLDREIPADRVESMLKQVLSAPVLHDIAGIVEKKIGRGLEPFDIWYDGFNEEESYSGSRLDDIVRGMFPDLRSFERQVPDILAKLGFSRQTASFIAERVRVDPARGGGHAWGARMKGDFSHLRTCVPKEGMDYQGFNTAMHELGHNAEQVLTLETADYYSMNGVPNTAFSEAFAFVFQNRGLEVLGLASGNPGAASMRALNEMWAAYETTGVSLLDMRIWRWLYQNPGAGAEKTGDAVVAIAREIWNEYYAPILGRDSSVLLAIYSHLIELAMYMPDYFIGRIISFQIDTWLRDRKPGVEMERMCRLGKLLPELWMREAVGSDLGPHPLIAAAEEAVIAFKQTGGPTHKKIDTVTKQPG